MIEVREVLRAWLAGKSEQAVAAQAGVDRKTSTRYVSAAVAAGLSRGGGEGQLSDELIAAGSVVSVVRRSGRMGTARDGRNWRAAASRSPRGSRRGCRWSRSGSCWAGKAWWWRSGRCTGSPLSGAGRAGRR